MYSFGMATMSHVKNFVQFAIKALFGLMVFALITVFLVSCQQPQPISTYPPQSSIRVSLPVSITVSAQQVAPTSAYPPPGGTILSPSPPKTPRPTFTPYPSPTQSPGESPTLIPLVIPAKDARGSILYWVSEGKDVAALYSLSTDEKGEILGTASKLSVGMVIKWGNIYPSPDGSRIAIIGDWGAATIFYPDSSKLTPLFESHVSPLGYFFGWHPDNLDILMRADENYPDLGLWLVNIETWEHTALAVPGIGRIAGGAVSPDGQQVIYSWQKDIFEPSEVWMVNTDGRGARLLFAVNGLAVHFAWSPDGKKIAFSGNGLEVMNVDGTSVRELGRSCLPRHYSPIWSPDSRFLAIMTAENDKPFIDPWSVEAFQASNICVVNVENGETWSLPSDANLGNMHPTWSPDGSQIAFVSNRSGTSEIWLVSADGSNLHQLTYAGQAIRFPYWRRP
ncbi:MAG: hypothetical protein D6732_23240 [Methanobacteriota archaeon]|nr:MAG: hypothetical protein D6732_23240 [Euryarchaeota archaeon]